MMKNIHRAYKYQRGQAISELVVGLLGLSFVMIGVLVVALLGMQGIRNTIDARSLADEYSLKGNQKGNARFIVSWKNSPYVSFGSNDHATRGNLSDPGAFTEELTDNKGAFHTHYLGTKAPYAENPFQLIESSLMVDGANLTFGTAIQENVLQKYKHFDAESILRSLGFPSGFVLREDICMPLNPK